MFLLFTDTGDTVDDWPDGKTGWEERRRLLLILNFCACHEFMCNKYNKNVFNAFL